MARWKYQEKTGSEQFEKQIFLDSKRLVNGHGSGRERDGERTEANSGIGRNERQSFQRETIHASVLLT